MSVKAILHGLNSRQRQAVETTKGPCLVLAGPGSGKTRVLTSRIAYLLEQGVAPEQILAITFTKKAATEMNDRVCELLGGVPRGLTIRTFHSLGYRILRDNARPAGLSVPFHIATETEQLAIVKLLVDDLDDDDPYFEAKDLLRRISLAKNHGISVDTLRRSARDDAEKFLADAYGRYDAALRERNAVDLDDLVLRPLREVLEADESVARAYQRRFRYIMIDEYQDTNGPQYELTKALLSAKRNLCVVGDDDQSIYGFRGSNVNHILKFADDFPGTRVIKFETNYRSCDQIVSLACRVIERARNRYPKRLTSHVGTGFPVECTTSDTGIDEADQVRERIRELVRASEASYDDMAILYRRHEDTKAMKLHLQAAGIPCRGSGANKSGVSLLTLHAAKGLEFPVVFLPSLEDKTVPHFHAIGEGPDAIEEERRLFYVGLTRAKSRLHLSSSSSRYGKPREESRFLTELGDAGGCLKRFARQSQLQRNTPAVVA